MSWDCKLFFLVCLKILLNLYKKKVHNSFFIETCIIFKEIYTINMVISLQIICKIYYLRGTNQLYSNYSHYFSHTYIIHKGYKLCVHIYIDIDFFFIFSFFPRITLLCLFVCSAVYALGYDIGASQLYTRLLTMLIVITNEIISSAFRIFYIACTIGFIKRI